jgi:hypothetical protein
MPSWGKMSCMQKTARVFMVIAILAIIACLVFNCVSIYRAATETWFTRCSDCANGNAKCGKRCCQDCTLKDEVFFYILRGYTLAFCLVAIVAEFKTGPFEEYLLLCHFFFPRGFWQIFLGLMTVDGNVIPGDANAAQWADIIGYFLVGVGIVHLFFGCICFGEYSQEKRDKEMKDLDSKNNAGPSQI